MGPRDSRVLGPGKVKLKREPQGAQFFGGKFPWVPDRVFSGFGPKFSGRTTFFRGIGTQFREKIWAESWATSQAGYKGARRCVNLWPGNSAEEGYSASGIFLKRWAKQGLENFGPGEHPGVLRGTKGLLFGILPPRGAKSEYPFKY